MTAADRRLTLCFGAAALAHALLLFGVALPELAPPGGSPLTVTLSTAPGARREASSAIAAANQTGADALSSEARRASRAAGDPDSGNRHSATPGTGEDPADIPLLARSADSAGQRTGAGERQAGGGAETAAESQTVRRRTAVADPRAAYLEGWRRAVERAGSRDFPHTALADARGEQRLTLEVTVRADGALEAARVRRSSGNPALDAAAQRILRDAAPYAPFPAELREQWQRLTFAYDWRFVPGKSGTVRVQTGEHTDGDRRR